MRYQLVRWLHDADDTPVKLYSELDEAGWEVRKVEEYANGHLDLAGAGLNTGETFLGQIPVPPLEEINSDPEFDGTAISVEQFDAVWLRARALHGLD